MSAHKKDTSLSRTIASTETLKLAEIHTLEYFYTPIEERFERITRLARCALKVPIAAVTLLSHEKQWFKSVAGWAVTELPLRKSLCTWTVEGNELVLVPDTKNDSRFASHPLVLKRPQVRFYAGYPLMDAHEVPVGTFCVMDVKPRSLCTDDLNVIRDLATLAQREVFADRLTDAQIMLTAKLGAARREAMIDPLTRLWNRRGATVLLKAALQTARDRSADLALGLLDIDRFKRINDLYGHQIGDKALRKVARVVVGSIRSEDIICRPAGDEFLLIMTHTDSNLAAQIVERVRRSVSECSIHTREGKLPITVSAGYTIYRAGEDTTEQQLFERADEALRQSKSAGRNRVRMVG